MAPLTPHVLPSDPFTTPAPVHPVNAVSGTPLSFASNGGSTLTDVGAVASPMSKKWMFSVLVCAAGMTRTRLKICGAPE